MTAPIVTGGCLCGSVRFRIAAASLRGVIVCHCSLCRRWGTSVGAFTWAAHEEIELVAESTLAVYVDARGRERSFCTTCGASLFWAAPGEDGVSVSAGALDDASELSVLRHIYVDDAAAWEEIPAGVPRHPQGSSSLPTASE